MLAVKRREIIVHKVRANKYVTVKELAEQFDVTDETIRNDLKFLEDRGDLFRTHGGAYVQAIRSYDVDVNYRLVVELAAKQKIAKIARNIINDNHIIFLDPSTTAAEIAKSITEMNLTVVTNSLLTTNLLANYPNIKIILIGGTFNKTYHCFINDINNLDMHEYFTQVSFVSCRSLCLEHGPMDSNQPLSQLRAMAIKNSQRVYLIADHTKFNEISLYKIASFEDLDGIITDEKPNDQWLEMAEETGIEILYPN
jgi:DeoR/GlpR family transcriptional regulator of sugar metabolism